MVRPHFRQRILYLFAISNIYLSTMRPTLCDTFRSRALWTWDTLARGRSVDYQIGQETLTHLNIFDLKMRHASEVYSRTFSKTE